MIGVGKYFNIVRYFMTGNKLLGLWLIVGFIDLYIFRYPIALLDGVLLIIYVSTHHTPSSVTAVVLYCKIVYFFVDVIFILEFYWSICLLYNRAIWYRTKRFVELNGNKLDI